MSGQNRSSAVMNQRHEAPDSLDYFPTPPWATRALLEYVIPDAEGVCGEPACGEGHMARPLTERFATVWASDIHDYGFGEVRDFLLRSDDLLGEADPDADWMVTNPPFKVAERFVIRMLECARRGVAILIRLTFLDTIGRYQRLFRDTPPAIIAQFSERVVIHKGQLAPDGSTATAYCWIVWDKFWNGPTEFRWIPPCRKRLERLGDYQ